MSKQLTTKESEAAFTALKASWMELAKECDLLTITDDTTLQLATQRYRELDSKIKQIEVIRVAEKKPYKEAGEEIDALAKALAEPLKTSLDAGKMKVLAYNKAKLAAAQAKQNRINAIKSAISKYSADAIKEFDACKSLPELTVARQERIIDFVPPKEWLPFEEDYKAVRITLNDYCKQRRIAIETPAQVDEVATEAIKQVLEWKAEEVGKAEVDQAEFTTTTKFRGLPRFRVVDESAIPREWLMVDEAKVKAYQKENKDTLGNGQVVNGIEFYIQENVSI